MGSISKCKRPWTQIMSILQKVPWLSLILVFLSYIALGWLVSETNPPLFFWFILGVGILLLLNSLTTPLSEVVSFYTILFESNLKSFAVTILAAFLFFLMIAWFRVFLDILLIISSTILAKIDFQSQGFKPGLTFWLISLFSFSGLGLGALWNNLV